MFQALAQDKPALHGKLSLPGKTWGVALELPSGFKVKTVETKPDGRRYLLAEDEAKPMVVSLTLEQVRQGAPSATCRESLEQKTKSAPAQIRDIRYSHSGNFDIMEYTVPEFAGQKIDQRSLFACELYDGTYIDLHVSKVNYVPENEVWFMDVMNTMHIDTQSSLELMEQGSRLYAQNDFKAAIGPYAEALEVEKVNPKLGKPMWYVLVDNLGMSYGITGELEKAKETFDYGVSRDPKYPLFYYNLACTYAEMGDVAKASNYLQKSFDHKSNVLPGESMPDPRTDDSFQKLMKDQSFRELAERLAKSR